MDVDVFSEALGTVALGGALVGLAAGLLMLLTGRALAASTIMASLLGGPEGPAATSIAVMAGLLLSPSILLLFGTTMPSPDDAGLPLVAIGGVLVGLGSRLSGASLGGAVCGLAQGSRGALLVLFAMASGVAISLAFLRLIGAGGAA